MEGTEKPEEGAGRVDGVGMVEEAMEEDEGAV